MLVKQNAIDAEVGGEQLAGQQFCFLGYVMTMSFLILGTIF